MHHAINPTLPIMIHSIASFLICIDCVFRCWVLLPFSNNFFKYLFWICRPERSFYAICVLIMIDAHNADCILSLLQWSILNISDLNRLWSNRADLDLYFGWH